MGVLLNEPNSRVEVKMRNKQIEDRKFEFSQTTEKIERIEP